MKEGILIGLTIALCTLFSTWVSAQIIRPESVQLCGPAIPTNQVMVLDLRSYGGRDIGGQRAFIKQHAGNYLPAHKNLYTVRVPQPVSTTDIDSPLVQSQIEASKYGCDLVLVYRSEIRSATDTGGWFATAEVQFATRTR